MRTYILHFPPLFSHGFPSSSARLARQGDLLRAGFDETNRTGKRLQSVDSTESEGEGAGAAAAERPVVPMAEFQRLCRAPHVVPWVRIFGKVQLVVGKWALKFYPGFFFSGKVFFISLHLFGDDN